VATRKPIQAVTTECVVVALARARREEAAALRAESRQAQRQAHALREAGSAILDAAVAIADQVLARRRLALAEPVAARFQTDEHGSSGIEITVRLRDPSHAAPARQALMERFGGVGASDSLVVT
jgi:hypothetical protein